jgi:predicted esterase
MPGWFDLGTPTQDDVGIQESIDYISELIDNEVKAGISADRILVAGFSQGGHLALKTVLKYHLKLAGCIAMSTWLEALSFEVRHTPAELDRRHTVAPLLLFTIFAVAGASSRRSSVFDLPRRSGRDGAREKRISHRQAVEVKRYAAESCNEKILRLPSYPDHALTLDAAGLNSTLNIYPGVAHSSNSQELRDVSVFIGALLPAVPEPSLTRYDLCMGW